MASEVIKSHLTLHSPGCCSCSFACSVPGWVEVSEPRRAASSSPAASSASRCPPSASRPAPAAWTEPCSPVTQTESATMTTCFWLRLSADLMRFWKAYPSVHCSVKEAPCRTVVKWPRRRRSCMLLSLHAIFSCLAWTGGDQKWIAENKQWLLCALKTHLFDKELLAHGHALVEPLLVALQHLLLLIHLSPQITVSLPTAAII